MYNTLFEETTRPVLKDNNATYTLSTFVKLDHVIPIFYEETIDGSKRLTFCFYYDNLDHKFKIQTYEYDILPRNYLDKESLIRAATLKQLEERTVVITDGYDIKRWANVEGDWFVKDHLNAMYDLIGDRPVAKAMRSLTNILNRMITPGDEVTEMARVLGRLNYSQIKAHSMKYIEINGSKRFYVPLQIKAQINSNCRDVLGKNRIGFSFPSSPVFIKENVVGFENINFVFTAKSLLSQYKLRHRLVDTVKQLVSG